MVIISTFRTSLSTFPAKKKIKSPLRSQSVAAALLTGMFSKNQAHLNATHSGASRGLSALKKPYEKRILAVEARTD